MLFDFDINDAVIYDEILTDDYENSHNKDNYDKWD